MKKKVGILTFHFSDNYGAVLQCYALRKVINEMSNYQAEVINFNPGRKEGWYTEKKLQQRYIEKLEKYKQFNKYENGIDSPIFYDIKEINQEEYDGFVVGSDQVWNTSFSFFNSAYLLDFVKENKKRIAYAASVGVAVESPRLKKELFEEWIPKFDYLSVREKTHQEFIQSYTDKNVETVLDPTLLLTKKEYDELIESTEEKKDVDKEGDYIFFYYLKHDDTTPLACSFVNMLSRKYNLKIVHFYVEMPEQTFKNENRSFYFEGPKDFIWYIKHAKIVVTNSFHGTVFSILYHKPFYTYIVKSMEARVLDLLEELKLTDRLIYGYKPLQDVSFLVDYSVADDILESKRKKSKKFLGNALGEKKDE